MKTLNIILKDDVYDLVDKTAQLKGKPISNTLDEILYEYFKNVYSKDLESSPIKFNESDEIWKDIPGYENQYQVSNMGRVASLRYGFKMRSCVKNPSGYLQVAFKVNGLKKTYLVHVLVANTFLGKVSGKDQVDHINNIKYDNRLENLQWTSRSENMKNNYTRGVTSVERLRSRGKKVELFSKDGETLGVFNSVNDAAKYLNASPGNISSLCNESNIRIRSLTKERITGKFI